MAATLTATDLITRALRTLNVIGLGDVPDGDMLADAYARLNDWIDALALEGQTIASVARSPFTLTSGIGSYTIGSGGAFNVTRPVSIDDAGLILDVTATPQIETPIAVLSQDRYEHWPIKGATGTPSAIYYDRLDTSGLGTITVLDAPLAGTYGLVLYLPQALSEFADLTTAYGFANGYRRFLQTNLPVELAAVYPGALTDAIVGQAIDAKEWLKRSNTRVGDLRVDPALRTRRPHGTEAALSGGGDPGDLSFS